MSLHEDQYMTLTFVVRKTPDTAGRIEVAALTEDPRVLLTEDEVMFWASEPGITDQALELGADLSSWHEDNTEEDS